MSDNRTIKQRISDFRALCAANRIQYKEVTQRAQVSYDSTINNMRFGAISDERMTLLEETALALRDEKKLQPTHS